MSRTGPYLPAGEQGFRDLFRAYRHSAKIAGRAFTLTTDEFRAITSANCHYCSVPPRQSRILWDAAYTEYIYNGVDRKDNKQGYVFSNCLPCCSVCNIMKKDWSEDFFIDHIEKIYQKVGGSHRP